MALTKAGNPSKAVSPGRPGRPTKYTPDVQAAICEALKVGAPIKLACQYGGIDDATYYRWQERFSEFREATTRARVGSAVRNLALIQKAASDDWRAADCALRLTFPEFFGKMALEISGNPDAPLRLSHDIQSVIAMVVETVGPHPDVRDALVQRLEVVRAQGDAP